MRGHCLQEPDKKADTMEEKPIQWRKALRKNVSYSFVEWLILSGVVAITALAVSFLIVYTTVNSFVVLIIGGIICVSLGYIAQYKILFKRRFVLLNPDWSPTSPIAPDEKIVASTGYFIGWRNLFIRQVILIALVIIFVRGFTDIVPEVRSEKHLGNIIFLACYIIPFSLLIVIILFGIVAHQIMRRNGIHLKHK
jgi:hypothetical protein